MDGMPDFSLLPDVPKDIYCYQRPKGCGGLISEAALANGIKACKNHINTWLRENEEKRILSLALDMPTMDCTTFSARKKQGMIKTMFATLKMDKQLPLNPKWDMDWENLWTNFFLPWYNARKSTKNNSSNVGQAPAVVGQASSLGQASSVGQAPPAVVGQVPAVGQAPAVSSQVSSSPSLIAVTKDEVASIVAEALGEYRQQTEQSLARIVEGMKPKKRLTGATKEELLDRLKEMQEQLRESQEQLRIATLNAASVPPSQPPVTVGSVRIGGFPYTFGSEPVPATTNMPSVEKPANPKRKPDEESPAENTKRVREELGDLNIHKEPMEEEEVDIGEKGHE